MKTVYSLMSLAMVLALVPVLTGCSGKGASYSLLPTESNFSQDPKITNGKIDILMVVDNSGSMASSQTNLANNLNSFISQFNQKGYDYRIAITTTDAYMDLFGDPMTQSKFRDGTDATSHTGVFVIDPTTPNLQNVFNINAKQGVHGSGDERAFQSFKETLNNPMNAGFPRADAFMSIIILSDEDDFSWDGATTKDSQYNDPLLHTVDSYVSYLDTLTGSIGSARKYNVNSISVIDQACKDQLMAGPNGGTQKIAIRYMDLDSKTNGIAGSICTNFGTTLAQISNRIIELTTKFYLDRAPVVSSIVVSVNGVVISVDAVNGYTYDSSDNSITFHGTSVPAAGDSIKVDYDPATIQ